LTGPFNEPTPDPSATLGTTDPLFDLQWGLAKIQAPQAWSRATGSGINIAIVDSGVDLGHEDFACPGKLSVLPGSDVGDGDSDPQDDNGHGTHVAGIAGACTDNGKGVAGVAPDATIIPVRALGDADLDTAMADGIRFATDNGAHVINLSIGDIPPFSHLGPDLFPETEAALEYARANGVVIAAAAGNFDQPTCEFPAMSRNVICVVATDSGDLRTYYTDFAVNVDRNSEEPGLEPVVAAPGGQGTFCDESIVSTYLRTEESICYDTGYEGLDGTSMSSPHVAGVAALIYELFGGVRTRANADAVVQAILDSAADLGTPGYDPVYGYGRLDALAAVDAVAGADTQLEFSSAAYGGTYSHPTTIEATLTGEDGEPLSGKDVVFELVGDGISDSWTVTTVAGLASKTLPEDLVPGTYQLFARFARENGVLQPSSAQAILDVGKEGTSITTGASGKGPNRILEATLVDHDGAPPIEGRTVVFYGIADEVLGSDVTDGNGFASIPAPPGYRGQDAIWEARFDGTGDRFYAGSLKRHPS
jgi:subtilisin family serine protease